MGDGREPERTTGQDLQKPEVNAGRDLQQLDRSSSLDQATAQQIAELEKKLAGQIDGRKEDLFYFALIVIAILDVVAIGAVQSILLVFPLLFELWVLAWLAKRLGVEAILTHIDWLQTALKTAIENWSKKPPS